MLLRKWSLTNHSFYEVIVVIRYNQTMMLTPPIHNHESSLLKNISYPFTFLIYLLRFLN